MSRFYHRHRFPAKANVPMVTATRDKLALELRMAGETVINRPSVDAYNTLSRIFAALERAGMRTDLVGPGSRIMCAICDRYEEKRAITVEREEATALRQAFADIDTGPHHVPLQRLERAVAEVEVFCTTADFQESA